LAWATSGSRGSAGKTSSEARSRRILGLSMRIRFTVISSPVAMSGGPLRTRATAAFATGSASDGMTRRRVGRHPKVDLTGGIFCGAGPGTKVPSGSGTGAWCQPALLVNHCHRQVLLTRPPARHRPRRASCPGRVIAAVGVLPRWCRPTPRGPGVLSAQTASTRCAQGSGRRWLSPVLSAVARALRGR